MKTRASLPTKDAALVLLFSLIASGHVKLRRIDVGKTCPRMLGKRVRQIEKPCEQRATNCRAT